MRAAIAGLVVAMAVGPVSAQTFQAENRVMVRAVEGGFNVADGAGQGARGMWCAAADFARVERGAKGTDRLYVAEGRGPGLGARSPIKFTLDKTGLTPVTVTIVGLSLRTAGSVLSVAHAGAFCADAKGSDR